MRPSFERLALLWLADDPDPQTRAELRAILDRHDEDALVARFAGKLEFGTAGLRGPLGAGPTRMNRVTVMRAAAGLARWLGPGRAVVIGFDARHQSDVFARDSAAVLAGAGLSPLVLPRPLPTPVLAYAVRHLGADAGVMVTASHNPARDNGYKVYQADGAQLMPPADEQISAAIDEVGPVRTLPRGEEWVTLDEEIVEAYVASLARLPLGDARDVRVAYTPLHGVGWPVLRRAFAAGGFPAPEVVAEQAVPDPDFPTTPFPNPEEPGVMDRVVELGRRIDADLALANDPDADRCAVALPAQRRLLTGDEVGALLAEQVLAHTTGADRLVVTTVVSSSLLHRIAAAHGVRFAQTLTGFKWIVRAGGGRLVYGYEEALGYCLGGDDGPSVRDKDGIAAALAVAGLAAAAKRAGHTLADLLDDLARRYGVFATRPLAFRTEHLGLVEEAMHRLRRQPPRQLGGRPIAGIDDLREGVEGLPPADVLRFRLAGQARVVVRPSGTEPKLKAYLEVVVPVAGDDVAGARRQAETALDEIAADVATSVGLVPVSARQTLPPYSP